MQVNNQLAGSTPYVYGPHFHIASEAIGEVALAFRQLMQYCHFRAWRDGNLKSTNPIISSRTVVDSVFSLNTPQIGNRV